MVGCALHRTAVHGGLKNNNYQNTPVTTSKDVSWLRDVQSKYPGDELLGNILYQAFEPNLIFEDLQCPVKYYYDRGHLDSLESQCIGTVLMVQHVRIFQMGEETFVGVKIEHHREELSSLKLRDWTYFGRMRTIDIVTMMQPNNTEIFEGRVKRFNLKDKTGGDQWYKLLSRWVCLDNIGEKFQIALIRARYLILSKLGTIGGFLVRQELFEERFGEVRLLVYGILPHGAVNFMIDREQIYSLMSICDSLVEKDKLEALDSASIAYIFSDRLSVVPSRNWMHFLNHVDLSIERKQRQPALKIRRRRGPGRLVGHRLIKLDLKVELLVSIFEINNDTNTQEMRIVLYYPKTSQTVEYRISAMERLMLFNEQTSIFEQIQGRLRVVLCDQFADDRKMIRLGKSSDFHKPNRQEFEVDGDDEYEILSQFDDWDELEEEDDDDEKSIADLLEESNILQASDERRSIHSSNLGRSTLRNSSIRRSVRRTSQNVKNAQSPTKSSKSADFNLNASIAEGDEDDGTDAASGADQLGVAKESSWAWAVYFNRGVLDEYVGNLVVSVAMSTTLNGFTVSSLDQRTNREAFRYVSFFDFCTLQYDKTLESLQDDLSGLDESVAFDLVDDLIALIDVNESDEEGVNLILASENPDSENLILARLKEYRPQENEVVSRKKKSAPEKFSVTIHAAQDLARLGLLGFR